jgi:MarR family transcriptional regulator, organic hydroperoxide resistance regulator
VAAGGEVNDAAAAAEAGRQIVRPRSRLADSVEQIPTEGMLVVAGVGHTELELIVADLRQLFDDLIRFEIEMWNAIDARLKKDFNLPLTHFEPMLVIERLPGCRVYDIASELKITTGGTSKLVDRIEASGYCRRLPNPADRRSSVLELTPAGRSLLAEAGEAFDEELRHWLGSAVPERTLRQFASTLVRLRQNGQRGQMEETA